MMIQINGEKKAVPTGMTIDKLIESYQLNKKSVVCELNHQVLDRVSYEKTQLQEHDTLEIVHFVGGG